MGQSCLYFLSQVFVKAILRPYLLLLRSRRLPAVSQPVVHKAGFALVRELDGKHVRQFPFQIRVKNWGYSLYAAIQVTAHSVRRTEEKFRLPAVAEVPLTSMFQKVIHDACYADGAALLLPGDEAADAADNEVYLYTGLRGFVEAVYHGGVLQGIHF